LSTWSVFFTQVSLFAFLSLCLFVFLSIYLFAFLLICLSINWSFFFPSVCLYASCSLINQTRVCFSKITKSPTRHWVKGKKGRKTEREKKEKKIERSKQRNKDWSTQENCGKAKSKVKKSLQILQQKVTQFLQRLIFLYTSLFCFLRCLCSNTFSDISFFC
jgi:hypothetical protein